MWILPPENCVSDHFDNFSTCLKILELADETAIQLTKVQSQAKVTAVLLFRGVIE